MFVSIYSSVQNRQIRRNLNDKNLTVESSGISHDQCWDEVNMTENRNIGIRFYYFQIKTKLIIHSLFTPG